MLHRRTLRGELIHWPGRILLLDLFRDARGLQTLEWVARAVAILVMLGAITATALRWLEPIPACRW